MKFKVYQIVLRRARFFPGFQSYLQIPGILKVFQVDGHPDIYIATYIHIHIQIHIYTYIYKYTHLYIYILIYKYIDIHKYLHLENQFTVV